jgi:hypothetical protein
LFRRLPIRCLLPGLPFRFPLRRFSLRLRRRQRLPGLLRLVAPGGNFISELQHLLLELSQARGHRRRRLRLVLFGRGGIGQACPLLPRHAQICIRLAEYGQTKQEQPGGRGRC